MWLALDVWKLSVLARPRIPGTGLILLQWHSLCCPGWVSSSAGFFPACPSQLSQRQPGQPGLSSSTCTLSDGSKQPLTFYHSGLHFPRVPRLLALHAACVSAEAQLGQSVLPAPGAPLWVCYVWNSVRSGLSGALGHCPAPRPGLWDLHPTAVFWENASARGGLGGRPCAPG